MNIASKYVEVNGINTHYHEEGSGSEKVILIHGSGPGVSAFANWRLVIPKLKEKVHVFAPDVVGFGKTEKVAKEKYTLDLWVNHLIAFIEEVCGESVHIVGNSFGGAMALHIAHRRPDLVKKLILMGAVGIKHDISYGLDKVWGYEPSLEAMRKLIELFSYDEAAAKDAELVKLRYEASMEEESKEAFKAMFFDNRQERLNELSLSEENLRAIEADTLLFHGLNDRIILFEDTSYRMGQLIPNAELHLFNECGHWTQIEKTDPFVAHLLTFIGVD